MHVPYRPPHVSRNKLAPLPRNHLLERASKSPAPPNETRPISNLAHHPPHTTFLLAPRAKESASPSPAPRIRAGHCEPERG